MSIDFRFALYVFCMDYHSGQWSRLYRLMCRLGNVQLSDRAIKAISGNRHVRNEVSTGCWEEWQESRRYYRELKRKYANDRK